MDLRSGKKSTLPPLKPKKTTSPAFLDDNARPKSMESTSKRLKKSNAKKTEIIEKKPLKTDKEEIPYIGASDFKFLREKGIIVDKTEFICEFLERPFYGIAVLFPRRFGKSTNLDMVKTFLEVEMDEYGGNLEDRYKTTPNYFLGGKTKDGKKSLEPLAISKHKEIVEKYM